MYNSPHISFAFHAKAVHKGTNLLCHQALIPLVHVKKEHIDHDRTALCFHKGSGPAAVP